MTEAARQDHYFAILTWPTIFLTSARYSSGSSNMRKILCRSGADMANEFRRRTIAPLRAQPFFRRNKIAAVGEVKPISIGPMLVHAPPGIGPVIVHLTSQQMTSDASHVLVLPEPGQVLVSDEHIVDILNFE